MFITKSQYKAAKEYWSGDRPRQYYDGRLSRSTPLTLRVSAARYRELAFERPERTAEYIVTAIRMLKQAIVCERLLKT